jgi:hypothetical protein
MPTLDLFDIDRPTPPIERDDVVAGVAAKVEWWVGNRRKKLLELRHASHAVNPLLLPIIMNMHGFRDILELSSFMLSGHLVEGHATGFGKLIDEKVLEDVFGTVKLDAPFRRDNPPFLAPEFDNIDHLVPRPNGAFDLLSLKAGRWSIQLGQAVQLNRSFQVLVDRRASNDLEFNDLVVGVFYGREADLTDKYRIIRGESGKAQHDVSDLTAHVTVLAGRPFWAWLNGGEHDTQDWILDGIILGFGRAVETYGPLTDLWQDFVKSFATTFAKHINEAGDVDWHGLLREING